MKQIREHYVQVSGILDNEIQLRDMLTDLHARGIGEDDISILMSENTRHKYFAMDDDTKAPEGTSIGGLSGGIIGAIIGSLSVVGTVLIPGVGLLVAGPLLGALAGAGIGGAAGGLVGALVGSGIPEHEAKFYEDAIKKEGNIFILVHVHKDDEKSVRAIFERYGAHKTKVRH